MPEYVSKKFLHIWNISKRQQKGYFSWKSENSVKSSNSRHYMSIGDEWESSFSTLKLSTRGKEGIHSMVVFKGLRKNKCSVLLDNGGGTSYALTLLIDKINKRLSKREVGNTDIKLDAATKLYHVDLPDIGDYHSFHLKVGKTDKGILIPYQTDTIKQFLKRKNISKKYNTFQPDKDFTNNSYLVWSFRV